jgi:hypothetical protein
VTKVQNLNPYPVDLDGATLLPGETAEVDVVPVNLTAVPTNEPSKIDKRGKASEEAK